MGEPRQNQLYRSNLLLDDRHRILGLKPKSILISIYEYLPYGEGVGLAHSQASS